MRAVIVDMKKNQAAALCETGRIVRIRNAGYEIGQTVELHELRPIQTSSMLKRLSSGIAAAVLVAMIGTGTAYAMPYGTVTLDSDSSVEYTINCFDYVLEVKGANEAGEALLSEIGARQLRHRRIDAAVAATVEHMEQPASLDLPEAEIRIVADTGNDHHTERLQQELEPLLEREQPPTLGMDPHPQRDEPAAPEDGPTPEREQPTVQEGWESAAPHAQGEPFAEDGEGREPHTEADGWKPKAAAGFTNEGPAQEFSSAPTGESVGEETEALPETSP